MEILKLYEDMMDDLDVTSIAKKPDFEEEEQDVDFGKYQCVFVMIEDGGRWIEDEERLKVAADVRYFVESSAKDFSPVLSGLTSVHPATGRDMDERAFIKFGFNVDGMTPKKFGRMVRAIDLAFLEDVKFMFDGERWYNCPNYTDLETDQQGLLQVAYRLFPFDKFGFRPFYAVVTDDESDRLEMVANVSEVIKCGKFDGTVDIWKIVEKYPDGYPDLSITVSGLRGNECYKVSRSVLDRMTFASGKPVWQNPWWQFGFDVETGQAFYSMDVFIGPVYMKENGNVEDAVLSCALYECDYESFADGASKFIKGIDVMFGGKFPKGYLESISEHIVSENSSRDEDEDDF